MVFTFHHTSAKAWSSILRAVLDAGFYVVSAWPVHSESRTHGHVQGKKAVLFDVVLTLRKRTSDGQEVEWDSLARSIEKRADELMQRFSQTMPITRKEDAVTIILGKCLELYSAHYPRITDGGASVPISEAIDRIEDLSQPFAEKWIAAQSARKNRQHDLTAFLRPVK
jgi:adenine-specific DNA methylase